ncbi:hypothetical protein [Microcoleus vaginatus]|uniref:hypothetical protein n=1 Tax=Microcoleus vaginatus TaxID=119532 RepID=UPI0002EA9F18
MWVYLFCNRSDRPTKVFTFLYKQQTKNGVGGKKFVADFKCAARSTRVKKMA